MRDASLRAYAQVDDESPLPTACIYRYIYLLSITWLFRDTRNILLEARLEECRSPPYFYAVLTLGSWTAIR